MSQLSYQATTIELPDDLFWADEFEWSPVVHTLDQTLSGALIVETAVKQAGRPVTLKGSESTAWITRATLAALQALAAVEGAVMTLALPGRDSLSVMFRLNQAPIQFSPVWIQVPPADDHVYNVTLNLMEV